MDPSLQSNERYENLIVTINLFSLGSPTDSPPFFSSQQETRVLNLWVNIKQEHIFYQFSYSKYAYAYDFIIGWLKHM